MKVADGITHQRQQGSDALAEYRRSACACTVLHVVDPARGAGCHSSPASLASTPERARGTPGAEDGLCLPPFACPPPPQPSRWGRTEHRHQAAPEGTPGYTALCPGPRRGRTEHRAPGGTRRYPWMTRPSALAHAVTRKRVTAVIPTQAGAAVRLTRHGAIARPETYRPPWV